MSEFIFGRLLKGDHKILGRYGILVKEVTGPSSYATGGFTVNLGEIRKIDKAFAVIENDNTPYKLSVSIDGDNKLKIVVNELKADTSTGAISASEVAAGTDLSSVKILVVAFVY